MFLKEFDNTHEVDWNYVRILDCCAGGDENHPMSYPTALKENHMGCKIDTIDIRDDSLAETNTSYLDCELDYEPDVIITNPPFNIAKDIILKALTDVKDGGWVIMLLRLNFFGSKGRKEFWDNNMPKYAFVHHKRIGFCENGKTDSIEYMHCCWQKGENPEYCKIKVI